jgi:hypothetical protein
MHNLKNKNAALVRAIFVFIQFWNEQQFMIDRASGSEF